MIGRTRYALARLLREVADWIEPACVSVGSLGTRASVLVRQAEQLETSGEHKRHRVYARLIKDFPDIRPRVLGLAIEMAMQDRP